MRSKYQWSDKPGRIIGYRKNGIPIRLIGGGSMPEGETVDPPQDTPAEKTYTQAELEQALGQARQQEKSKLHSKINGRDEEFNSVKTQLAELLAERNASKAEADARAAADTEAARKAAEDEMTARDLVLSKEQELRAEIAQIRREGEQERAILEKDRQMALLAAYTQRRVTEESENIAPQLMKYVGGDTQEEVEASIAAARQTTDEIYNDVTNAQAVAASGMRGVSTYGSTPANGPLDTQTTTETYSAEEIAAMPMSKYKELRTRLPGVGGNASNGLFG